MKAYLIDPFARTVTEVSYNGNYKQIYELVDCQTFCAVEINEHGDTIFLDDEGLLHGPTSFFKCAGYPTPLAGKGLVLGTDDEGESVEPSISLEILKTLVEFGDVINLPGIGAIAWAPAV